MRYMTSMPIFDVTHLERGMAIQVTTTNGIPAINNRVEYNALIRAVTPLKLIIAKIRDDGSNEEIILTSEEVAHRKVSIELLTPCGESSYGK